MIIRPLNPNAELTHQQVADKIGMSKRWVIKLEQDALRKLRRSPALFLLWCESNPDRLPKIIDVRKVIKDEKLKKLSDI